MSDTIPQSVSNGCRKYVKSRIIINTFNNVEYQERNKEIIRTSVVGIAANVLLAGFKAVVGAIAGSVAIIMDAVNNLSDALSSVITIVGTKLSARPADGKHPFGHGRIEYFSAIVISIIVLIAGVSSLIESVKKIFNPTKPEYTAFTLVVIVVAILVKLVLGRYVSAKGKKLQSDSLIASGADATFDAVVTLSTLISAGIMLIAGINLDGIFGTLISLVIIKAGVEMLGSPINQLLGTGVSPKLTDEIRKEVEAFPNVHGVYDIILNDYGPNTIIGSLHVNVLDTLTAREIHGLTRDIAEEMFYKHGIILTVGVYAINTEGKLGTLQKDVMTFINNQPDVLQSHGFYFYSNQNLVTIDIIPNKSVHDDNVFAEEMKEKLNKQFPDYKFSIVIDHDYTEES